MAKTVRSGEVSQRAGKTMLLMGFLLGWALVPIPEETWGGGLPLVLLLDLVLILGGAFLYWRGRQHASRAKAAAILDTGQPTVLYLRPFSLDPSGWGNVLSSLSQGMLAEGLLSEEEQLCEVLQPFGDMVAVGKPNESLPTPGAARLYASDAEWQDVVAARMRAARLVVICAGDGAGLQWELEQVTQMLDPRRLLIRIGMNRRHYDAFRTKAASFFNLALPPFDAIKRLGSVSGFLRFGPGWQASLLPLRLPPFLRQSLYKSRSREFKYALKPVFEDFGLTWEQPPIPAEKWVLDVALLLSVGVLLVLLVIGLLFG